MTDIVTILVAATANVTGPAFDAGDLKSGLTLQTATTGSVSAFSVQLQGSLDAASWVALGSPQTTATTAGVSTSTLARYFRAVLSGFTGTGTVTVKLGFTAGAGYTGAGGGSSLSQAQSDARYAPGSTLLPSGDTSGATDSAAIQALVNLGTQQIILAPGQWYTGTTRISLTAGPGIRILGSGSVMNDLSATNATVINCGGSASANGLFFFSHTSSLVTGTEIGNLAIIYSGTGNVFDDLNLQSGYFHDLNIALGTQGSASAFFTGPSETANNSVIQVTLERVTVTSTATTRSVPMISITSQNSGGISDLTFFRCKFNNTGQDHAQPAVLVQCTATGAGYHYATTFRDCYFEKPLGGAIRSLSGSGLLVENCMFWDMSGLAIGGSTVYVGAGSGNIGSQGVKITGCGRNRAGPNGSAFWDVECESTTAQVKVEGFHILAASQTTATNAFFNFHGCADVVLENNVYPQGAAVNGNSSTVVTNPSPTQVTITGGTVSSTSAAVISPSGDTSGAADTAAINASITANGHTLLTAGAFWVTNVGMTVNARWLQGSGPDTIVNVVASQPGIVLSGPGQVTVSDMQVAIGAGSYGMTVNGMYDGTVRDIIMTGTSAAGGIKVNGDDATEQHYTDIVMRTVGGIAFDLERTTSIYTGSLYLDRVRIVTPPSGGTGFRLNSTAGSPSLNTIFMTQCVADAYLADAYYANNVAQVFVSDCWFAVAAGATSGSVAMRITGGLQHSYNGCYTYNGLTSGTDVLVTGTVSGISLGGGHVFDGTGGNTALSLAGATGSFALGTYQNYCGTLTDAAAPQGLVDTASNQSVAGNKTFLNNATFTGDGTAAKVISTGSGQFDGPGVYLYNSATSMGNQGGIALQAGIANTGATQGYATIAQISHAGAFVTNVITVDLNAQTITALFPLIAGGNKITGSAFLCPPVAYGPGSRATLTATTTTMAALSSANVNTGSFTAPASGSVLVTASFVAQINASARWAVGLAAHGTVTPLVAPLAEFMDNGTSIPRFYSVPFLVTGLTAGTSYNFDLLGAAQSTETLSVFALGTTTTTPGLASGSDGCPVTMTVQPV